MIYSLVLPPNTEVKIERKDVNILRICQAALSLKTPLTTQVFLKKEDQTFLIATLDPNNHSFVPLELYLLLSEEFSLLSDNAEVHIIGYYHPSAKDLRKLSQLQIERNKEIEKGNFEPIESKRHHLNRSKDKKNKRVKKELTSKNKN